MSLESDVKDIWKKFNANVKHTNKKKFKDAGYDNQSTFMGRLEREAKNKKDTSSN